MNNKINTAKDNIAILTNRLAVVQQKVDSLIEKFENDHPGTKVLWKYEESKHVLGFIIEFDLIENSVAVNHSDPN